MFKSCMCHYTIFPWQGIFQAQYLSHEKSFPRAESMRFSPSVWRKEWKKGPWMALTFNPWRTVFVTLRTHRPSRSPSCLAPKLLEICSLPSDVLASVEHMEYWHLDVVLTHVFDYFFIVWGHTYMVIALCALWKQVVVADVISTLWHLVVLTFRTAHLPLLLLTLIGFSTGYWTWHFCLLGLGNSSRENGIQERHFP